MQDSQLNFQPTRSFAYRFARYTVLPEVAKEVAELGDEPFLLREIAWPIIDRLLTKELQAGIHPVHRLDLVVEVYPVSGFA